MYTFLPEDLKLCKSRYAAAAKDDEKILSAETILANPRESNLVLYPARLFVELLVTK
jgi:hypothetical protein